MIGTGFFWYDIVLGLDRVCWGIENSTVSPRYYTSLRRTQESLAQFSSTAMVA